MTDITRTLTLRMRLAILAALSIGWFLPQLVSNDRPANIPLELDSEYLGPLWSQDVSDVSLDIINNGTQPLHIRRFRSACECTSIYPSEFLLGPGKRQTIQMSLELQRVSIPNTRGNADIPYSLTLSAAVEGYRTGKTWLLKSHLRKPYVSSSEEIDFGSTLVLGEPPPVTVIELTPHTAVESLSIRDVSNAIQCELTPNRVDGTYSLAVSPAGVEAPGYFEGAIRLNASTFDGGHVVTSIRVTGRATTPVRALPGEVNIGSARLGTTVSGLRLSVSARDASRLRDIQQIADLPGLTVSLLSVTNACAALDIEQEIVDKGHNTNVLKLRVTTEDKREYVVDVPIMYYGIAGET